MFSQIRIHQGGKKLFVKTTSGSVRIHAPFQEISSQSVSGSIRIVANQESKQIVSSAISGSTSIQLENVSSYEFDYSTTSGSIKDTYEGTKFSKLGSSTQGDSSLKMNVSSISGSIKLEDWEN